MGIRKYAVIAIISLIFIFQQSVTNPSLTY